MKKKNKNKFVVKVKVSQKNPNKYPKGWDRKRVQELADYYDTQTDADAIAEMEAAFDSEACAMIQVPIKLLPAIRKVLSKKAG